MPTIGWFEILIIVGIAIVVLGPKDFPIMLKKAGSWIGTAKKYMRDIQSEVSNIDIEEENTNGLKENIEFKIFEYHEGLLNPHEQAELLNFIKIHPEYQLDFDAMEKSYLKDEDFVYQHANELLMPEQQQAKSFLGWRLGLSVFLISLLSYGVYQKINTNN